MIKYLTCPVCDCKTPDVTIDNAPVSVNHRECDECNTTFFKHPEQKDNEVFLINLKDGERWGKPSFMESIRIGKVAYTTWGESIVKNYKPLFGILK